MVKRAWAALWIWWPRPKTSSLAQHVNKAGESKLLPQCSLPLTGVKCVKKIVTELAVLEVAEEGGFRLFGSGLGNQYRRYPQSHGRKLIVDGEVPEMEI